MGDMNEKLSYGLNSGAKKMNCQRKKKSDMSKKLKKLFFNHL